MFADGAAYCLGTINQDCWYLYTLNPLNKIMSGRVDTEPDQTIEILMTELDPHVMETFTKKRCRNGREATKVSNIRKCSFKRKNSKNSNDRFQVLTRFCHA